MAIITCPNCGAKNRVDQSRARTEKAVCGRCHQPLPVDGSAESSGHPIALNDSNFDVTLRQAGAKPVLVDCWAPWCGPCRMIAPVIEQLASESDGRAIIAKVNTDENPQIAARYQISAIPTLLIFKQGALVERLVGLQSKQAISAKLAAHA